MHWAEEDKPPEFWSDACIDSSIMQLFYELIQWFIDRSCPHYSIVANNMLDHIEDTDKVNKLVDCMFSTAPQVILLSDNHLQNLPLAISNLTVYETLSVALTKMHGVEGLKKISIED